MVVTNLKIDICSQVNQNLHHINKALMAGYL